MRLLLDTHFLIWAAVDQEEFTASERRLLIDPATEIFVSMLSIWEVRIKWNQRDRSGHRKGRLSPDAALRVAKDSGFLVDTLTVDDPVIALDPPLAHKDPFDEMLLIHAQRLGARLLTRDRLLVGHPLALTP